MGKTDKYHTNINKHHRKTLDKNKDNSLNYKDEKEYENKKKEKTDILDNLLITNIYRKINK